MRTSLNNIQLIEQYLGDELSVPERLLFEARMLTNPALRLDVWLQKKVLKLVGLYHREQIRKKVRTHHDEFFHNPDNAGYRKRVVDLFNGHEL